MAEGGKKPHSVKVPRLYKEAAKALSRVEENKEGLKNAVFSVKHPNVKGVTALVSEALRHGPLLAILIEKSKITEIETGLGKQVSLTKILMTELLWGKKRLGGEAKPMVTVNKYQEKFEKIITKLERRNKMPECNLNGTAEIRKPRYVRVNTLKMSTSDAVEYLISEGWIQKEGVEYNNLTPDDFVVDDFVSNVIVFATGTEFYRHPLYLNGTFVLQDKASCLPALALKPRKGRTVLDACAAPGMKTSYLAGLMENDGKIIAVEKNNNRCETLNSMLDKMGVTCATVINKDFTDIEPEEFPEVEYILVDPSCSGSGMYSRIDAQIKRSSQTADRLFALSHCQMKLLLHAMKFPNVKRIVYSTCSINSEENEDVVAAALNFEDNYSNFQLKSVLPSWSHRLSNSNYSWADLCVKSDFETDLTDGFFVSVIERVKSKAKRKRKAVNDDDAIAE